MARPITTGIKRAVAAVLLINALRTAGTNIVTRKRRFGWIPTLCKITPPAISTTPVRSNAAVRINKRFMTKSDVMMQPPTTKEKYSN